MRGDGGASKLLERVRRRVGEELSMPPRRCEEHYRHELKYLISYGQKADLNLRLAPLLEQDSHARGGCYMIRSLYFDDYWNTAYQEKVDGVLMRKKYRIRIYDYSDRVIKLERKRKSDSWIYKEDAPLTHEQFDRILAGDYESADIVPLLKEMFAFISEYEGEIPGAAPEACGNYLDLNLPMAKYVAKRYLTEVLENITRERLNYQ